VEPLTKTWIPAESDTAAYPSLGFGAAIRARYVDLSHALSLGDTTDHAPRRRFLRLRSQFWLEYRLSARTRAYMRLNNESRKYFEPDAFESRFDEIIFENLYAEFTGLFGLPVGIRIGRQDLFYGDGFVICDGGALDGSRTTYVNGVLLTSRIPLWSFDTFMAWDPKRDKYLPRINNRYTQLLETDEFLAGLFLRRLASGDVPLRYTFEPYYIYKTESAPDCTATIHTFGARVTFPIYGALVLGEFAYQGGRAPESNVDEESTVQRPRLEGPQSISAFGGWARIQAGINSPVPVRVTGGYIYLSGDDRTTRNKYEGWNPILGRWPLWSELYIYTLVMEKDAHPMRQGIAYWQNMESPYAELEVRPYPTIALTGRYMWLYANEPVFADPKAGFSTKRGDLMSLRGSWTWWRGLAGHVLYERFWPGSFYDALPRTLYPEGAKQARFFRVELRKAF
jgi:hypothetical protein